MIGNDEYWLEYFLSVSNTDVPIGKGNSLGYSFYLTGGNVLFVLSVKGITVVGVLVARNSWSFTFCLSAVPSRFYTFAGGCGCTHAKRSQTLLLYCTVPLYFGVFNCVPSTCIKTIFKYIRVNIVEVKILNSGLEQYKWSISDSSRCQDSPLITLCLVFSVTY